MNCLTVSNISKYYGKKAALKNVTFTLKPGIYGLLGPNGAGKSTLMHILTLTKKVSEGTIQWNDMLIKGGSNQACSIEYLKSLSYVPQEQIFYSDFTAWEFLDYIALLKAIPKEEIAAQIKSSLTAVELWNHAHEKIRTYSGGMKQRLMIAQALLNKPALLLLDEPTTGLDPRQRMVLKELLVGLSKDTIILISTHIVSDVEKLADEIILINRGQILKMLPPDQLISETVTEEMAEFTEEGSEIISDLEKAYLFYCREGAEDA